jgi:hypothetical protein
MTYSLAFTGRAAVDIINAFEWYEARRFVQMVAAAA